MADISALNWLRWGNALEVIHQLDPRTIPADAPGAAARLFGPWVVTPQIRPPLRCVVRYYVHETFGEVVVFFAGMGPIQIPAVLKGWNLAHNVSGGRVHGEAWADAGTVVSRHPSLLSGGKLISIYGHSAGGIVAEVLARRLQLEGTSGRILELTTFGSPNGATAGAYASIGERRTRLVARGDPVVNAPFVFAARPNFALAVVGPFPSGTVSDHIQYLDNLQHFIAPDLGVQLGFTGNPEPVSPPDSLNNQAVALAEWWRGSDMLGGTVTNVHADTHYLGLVRSTGKPSSFPRPALSLPPIQTAPPQLMMAMATLPITDEEVVLATPEFSGSAPEYIQLRKDEPMSNRVAFIDSTIRPKIIRVARDSYQILWFGNVVIECETLSNAKVQVKRLMQWARWLTHTKVVYYEQLEEGIREFIGVAGSTPSKYHPPLTLSV